VLDECVIHGTTEPNGKFREKVAKTLKARPLIAARIARGKTSDQNGNPVGNQKAPSERGGAKAARGHMSYELGLQHIEEPASLIFFLHA